MACPDNAIRLLARTLSIGQNRDLDRGCLKVAIAVWQQREPRRRSKYPMFKRLVVLLMAVVLFAAACTAAEPAAVDAPAQVADGTVTVFSSPT